MMSDGFPTNSSELFYETKKCFENYRAQCHTLRVGDAVTVTFMAASMVLSHY